MTIKEARKNELNCHCPRQTIYCNQPLSLLKCSLHAQSESKPLTAGDVWWSACLSNKARGSNHTAHTGAKFQLSLSLDSSPRIPCIGSCLGPKMTYAQAQVCSLVAFVLSNNQHTPKPETWLLLSVATTQQANPQGCLTSPAQIQNVVRAVFTVLDYTTAPSRITPIEIRIVLLTLTKGT